MSHFTRVKTKIVDREILEKVLKDLNYIISPIKKVTGWRNTLQEVDFAIKTKNQYSIGFSKNKEGSYDIVADWWAISNSSGLKEKDFVNQINQRYAYEKVLSEVKKEGFIIAEEKVESDNSICLTVRKW